MKEPMYLDFYEIRNLSLKLINYKDNLIRKYKKIKFDIKEKYEYLKYSYKYTHLLNKVVRDNNLKINRNAKSFNDIILNNNLQDVKSKDVISIVDSYLKFSVKLQGMDINSICRTIYEKPEETERGFLVTRYGHDKGYSYINYIKFYNLNGIYFKLDLYSIDNKITEIIDIYYQEDFDSLIIVGKKLTYGENIKNNYIIKVFTKFHKLKRWHEFVEIKTGGYLNDVEKHINKYTEYKKNVKMFLDGFNNINPNLICIDTIDVSKLPLLKDVKDVDISIGSRGIDIVEIGNKSKGDCKPTFQIHDINDNEVFLNKKYINIYYSYDERVVEDRTVFVDNIFKSDMALLHPGSRLFLNNGPYRGIPTLDHNGLYDSSVITSGEVILKKQISDLTEEVKFLKEEVILVADPKLRLTKKVKEMIEEVQKNKLFSMNLFNKKDVSLHPLQDLGYQRSILGYFSDCGCSVMFGKSLINKKITNNNYNREFISFDRNYVKKKK